MSIQTSDTQHIASAPREDGTQVCLLCGSELEGPLDPATHAEVSTKGLKCSGARARPTQRSRRKAVRVAERMA